MKMAAKPRELKAPPAEREEGQEQEPSEIQPDDEPTPIALSAVIEFLLDPGPEAAVEPAEEPENSNVEDFAVLVGCQRPGDEAERK
jgi:hypothetical protein